VDCELTRYHDEITFAPRNNSEAVEANIASQMRLYGLIQEKGVEINAILRPCKHHIQAGKSAMKCRNSSEEHNT
jgi:hypothetical protein